MPPHSRSYEIYSSLRNAKLPTIAVNYDSGNYDSPERTRSKSHQNSSSLILYDYETTLKKQIEKGQMRQHLRKERKRHKTLEAQYLEQKKMKQVEGTISQELQAIKYNLRSLSMLKQTEIRKKQKMIMIKSHIDDSKNHASQHYNPLQMAHQHLQPYYNPVALNPYNPYGNPHNPYSNPYQNNYYAQNNYQPHPNSYTKPYQKHRSHHNISQSPKNDPYVKISKKMTPKQTSPQSKLAQSKQQSRYSTLTQTLPISTTVSLKANPKKEFNRSQFKKRLNDMQKYNIRQQAIKKMLRCFWSVFFCVSIKKQALKIVNQRRKFFSLFWPSQFMKFLQTFKDYFYTSFFPFFKLLKQRQSTYLLADEDESKPIKSQKKKTFKQLLKIFFTFLKQIKEIENLGKAAWGFCSNGSFVEKGVLTKSQLEYLCFNEGTGTLLMDENLEKSQIITFVLIKILLFKFVLNADKKWPLEFNRQKNPTLTENLKLVASFIYDIMIQAQQTYLSQVDHSRYPLNNYREIKQKNKSLNLQLSAPLMFQTTTLQQGEIISGLHSQQFIKQKLKIKKTQEYVETVKEVVEGLHKVMSEYDRKFRAKVRKRGDRIVRYKY